jgi:hypothetical protein
MCEHHVPGPWTRNWDVFLLATVGAFAVLECSALATEGSPATLSAHIWRLAGIEPRCQHARIGRSLILAVLLWAAAHLGWGVLGFGLPRWPGHPKTPRRATPC